MSILVTGGSGFLGSALIDQLLTQGHKVYSVSRHAPELREGLIPLRGDILEPDFGMINYLAGKDFTAFYHLAAVNRLGKDHDGSIWETNVTGTKNVVKFCLDRAIPHLYYCSTAYTAGSNTYELSKSACETIVRESGISKFTIFKPSIIMGTDERPFTGHLSQFVLLLIRIHKRAEIIRRKIEGTLRLPIIEPLFRIKGDPEDKLNLIQIDQVADAMAKIKDQGVFWLTHPDPPTLQQLADWVSEVIMVKIKFEPEFKPTPIEATFEKMAVSFAPYLQGDDFPSNLQLSPPINKSFIQETVKRTLTGST